MFNRSVTIPLGFESFFAKSKKKGPKDPYYLTGGGASLERTLLCRQFPVTGKNTGNNCSAMPQLARPSHRIALPQPVRSDASQYQNADNRELTGNNNLQGEF